MTIRPATLADAGSIAALAGELGYPSTPAAMHARLAPILASHDNAVFVADIGGTVTGWIHVSIVPSVENDDSAEIRGLVVASTHRSRGVGAELVAAAEIWARAGGRDRMRVRSNIARERTRSFYERLGYLVTKTQHAFDKNLLLAIVLCLAAFTASAAELSPGVKIPDAAKPGPNFDVERATQSYLELLTPEQRARSDAYFEGGYWLELWDVLYTLAVAALLLFSGLSRKMRDTAQRILKRPFLTTWLYVVFWFVAVTLLTLPFTIYTGFVREHKYGLATQTFGAWLGDAAKGFALGLVFLPLLIAFIYWAIRKAGENWWVWASVIVLIGMIFVMTISPVFVMPMFNKYTPLPPGKVRDEVLALARANRIPAHDVYVVDASRQTTRVSANVSGLFGTTRISLNDNLLNRSSLEEIRAVLGHEMGHYVLNHGARLIIYFTLVISFGFFIVHRAFD
ncbi:MAG TPA: GNAT family N-acetyltransferase, partial [Thermoanaerobaculia bacterium]|nr:GNAT family N-acetyltransferase [Thermoanaerobaculia bacterium]